MPKNTAIRALQLNEVYDETLDMIIIEEEHWDYAKSFWKALKIHYPGFCR